MDTDTAGFGAGAPPPPPPPRVIKGSFPGTIVAPGGATALEDPCPEGLT
ncbi:MAG: hypothetical protein ACTSYG_10855 [Candidatus Heimdallarchaeota archaeon]